MFSRAWQILRALGTDFMFPTLATDSLRDLRGLHVFPRVAQMARFQGYFELFIIIFFFRQTLQNFPAENAEV